MRFRWVALCILSCLLATLTWRLIETPTRDRRRVSTRTLILGCAGAALTLAAVAVAILLAKGGAPTLSAIRGRA